MLNWIKEFFSAPEKSPDGSATVVDVTQLHAQLEAGIKHKEQGDAYLSSGDFIAAEACYRQAIAVNSGLAKAHSNLGFVLKEQGRFDEAEQCLTRALAIDPAIADAHYMLGLLSQEKDKMDIACIHFRKALELAPDFEFACRDLCFLLHRLGRQADAKQVMVEGIAHSPASADLYFDFANTLHTNGKLAEAICNYQRALDISPEMAAIHINLGNALQSRGQMHEAAACYRQALAADPDSAAAHTNLGLALKDLGQLAEAATSLRQALKIDPEMAAAHCNLGIVLHDLKKLDDAVASYRRALVIKPDFMEAFSNLGNVLHDLGKFNEALTTYRHSLAINPGYDGAHYNLGVAFMELDQINSAANCFRQALEIQPGHCASHNNLATTFGKLGEIDKAVACYRRALEIKPEFDDALSNLLFTYNYLSDQSTVGAIAEARRYGALAERRTNPYTIWPNVLEANRCLQVGLVSGDLRNHPVGFFAEGILAALAISAKDSLRLNVYQSHPSSDFVTERIKLSCHTWSSVAAVSDENLAQKIHDDGIDILIDLSGHTRHNRLPTFAWKPAPIQVSWLGYFATTGVAAIDYLIADPWTLPTSEEVNFTEKIWRLPETRLSFTAPKAENVVVALPALANGYVTFGCFSNLGKINDSMICLWAKVLNAIPDSRLFIKTSPLHETIVQNKILHRFASYGIAPQRLILEGASPRLEYLATYNRIDIVLDTFPFPGGTTSAESLWMGVPVLTMAGERFLSRQGVGLLMNAGLPEWIAVDQDDYVARAVRHASDLQRLAALRKGLRQQVLDSPIFDAPRFARHFEEALRGMWTHWCNQQTALHS